MKTFSKFKCFVILLIFILNSGSLNAQWIETTQSFGIIRSININDSSIYLGTLLNGIYKSNDNGQNWTPKNTGFSSIYVKSIIESTPYLYSINSDSVYRSDNYGQNWFSVKNGLPTTSANSISAIGNSIFLTLQSSSNNLYKSTDYGLTWSMCSVGLPQDYVANSVITNNAEVLAATNKGVFKSYDLGYTWTNISANIGVINVSNVITNSLNPVIYAITNGQSYKSLNNGNSWTLLNFPYGVPACLISYDSLLFAGKNPYIYLSNNYGTTWQTFSYGLNSSIFFTFNIKDSLIYFGGEKFGKRLISDAFLSIGDLSSIIGDSIVCNTDTNVLYTTQLIQGAHKYIWTFPGGIVDTTNVNYVYHNFTSNSQSGVVKVKALNMQIGLSNEVSKSITVNAIPSNPQNIIGPINVYKGQNAVKYKVIPVAGANSYSWTLSPGMTGNSNSDSILINFSSTCQSGNIFVKAINNCGESQSYSYFITLLDSGYFQLKISANNKYGDTVGVFIGDTVFLKAEMLTQYVYNGFNNAQLGNGWTNTGSVMFNNPCQCPFVGGLPPYSCINGNPGQLGPFLNFAWMNGNNFQPSVLTPNIFLNAPNSNQCKIRFWMMYGLTPDQGVCEDPDSPYEGVFLQYSINNGVTWTNFPGPNVYPVGNLSLIPPYNTLIKGSGGYWEPASFQNLQINNPLYYWNQYENTIPANAISANTKFRWYQDYNSTSGYDSWGIDEVEISCNASSVYNTQWLYNGNVISTNLEPTPFILNQGGYYQYIVTVTDSIFSFSVSDTIVVFVQQMPSAAGNIIGPDTICAMSSNILFSVPPITNATSYIWTLPNGFVGSSSTNNILVNIQLFNWSSVIISVKGHNSSGDGIASSKSIIVRGYMPGDAGVISSPNSVCQGEDSVLFSIPIMPNTQTYYWTFNNTIYTSNTNNIKIDIPINAISPSLIKVKGRNNCSNIYGAESSKSIVINPLPRKNGNIIGLDSVCDGQFSVIYKAFFSNADSYNWYLPVGANGVIINDTIFVDFSFSNQSDYIKVKGVNICGTLDTDSLFVHITDLPEIINITMSSDTLFSSFPFGNQWYSLQSGLIPGANQNYYIPQQNGDYSVIVTIDNCSSDASDFYHVDNVGYNKQIHEKFNFKVVPNPFSDKTHFIFTLFKNSNVKLCIFDFSGRIVDKIDYSYQKAGLKQIEYNADNLQSGIYYYQLFVDNEIINGKIILSK